MNGAAAKWITSENMAVRPMTVFVAAFAVILLACTASAENELCPPDAESAYMDILLSPAAHTAQTFVYSLGGNYTKVGIPKALVIRVNLTNLNDPNAPPDRHCYHITDGGGFATFPYDPNYEGCLDYQYIFCPQASAMNLSNPITARLARQMCLNDTVLPQAIIDGDIAACPEYSGSSPPQIGTDLLEYRSDYLLTHNELYLCNQTPKNFAPLCWPLMLIFGILVGASFALGKNPFNALDISSPRMSRGKQYSLRAQQKNFDLLTYAMGAVSAAKTVGNALGKREIHLKDGDGKDVVARVGENGKLFTMGSDGKRIELGITMKDLKAGKGKAGGYAFMGISGWGDRNVSFGNLGRLAWKGTKGVWKGTKWVGKGIGTGAKWTGKKATHRKDGERNLFGRGVASVGRGIGSVGRGIGDFVIGKKGDRTWVGQGIGFVGMAISTGAKAVKKAGELVEAQRVAAVQALTKGNPEGFDPVATFNAASKNSGGSEKQLANNPANVSVASKDLLNIFRLSSIWKAERHGEFANLTGGKEKFAGANQIYKNALAAILSRLKVDFSTPGAALDTVIRWLAVMSELSNYVRGLSGGSRGIGIIDSINNAKMSDWSKVFGRFGINVSGGSAISLGSMVSYFSSGYAGGSVAPVIGEFLAGASGEIKAKMGLLLEVNEGEKTYHSEQNPDYAERDGKCYHIGEGGVETEVTREEYERNRTIYYADSGNYVQDIMSGKYYRKNDAGATEEITRAEYERGNSSPEERRVITRSEFEDGLARQARYKDALIAVLQYSAQDNGIRRLNAKEMAAWQFEDLLLYDASGRIIGLANHDHAADALERLGIRAELGTPEDIAAAYEALKQKKEYAGMNRKMDHNTLTNLLYSKIDILQKVADASNLAARTNNPLFMADYAIQMKCLTTVDSAIAGIYCLAGNDLTAIVNSCKILTPDEAANLALAKHSLVNFYQEAVKISQTASEVIGRGIEGRHELVAKRFSDYQEAINRIETAHAALMSGTAQPNERIGYQNTINACREEISLMNRNFEGFARQLARLEKEMAHDPNVKAQVGRCVDAGIRGDEIGLMKECHALTLAGMDARDLSGNAYERGMGADAWNAEFQKHYANTLESIEALRSVSENDPSYRGMMDSALSMIEKAANIAQTAWTTSNQYLNMQLGNASDSALAPNYLNQSEQSTIEGIVGYSRTGMGNPFGQRFLPRMPWQSVSEYAIPKLSFTADDALVAPARPIEWNAPAPNAPTLVTRAGMTFEIIPEIRADKTVMVVRPYQMNTWEHANRKQLEAVGNKIVSNIQELMVVNPDAHIEIVFHNACENRWANAYNLTVLPPALESAINTAMRNAHINPEQVTLTGAPPTELKLSHIVNSPALANNPSLINQLNNNLNSVYYDLDRGTQLVVGGNQVQRTDASVCIEMDGKTVRLVDLIAGMRANEYSDVILTNKGQEDLGRNNRYAQRVNQLQAEVVANLTPEEKVVYDEIRAEINSARRRGGDVSLTVEQYDVLHNVLQRTDENYHLHVNNSSNRDMVKLFQHVNATTLTTTGASPESQALVGGLTTTLNAYSNGTISVDDALARVGAAKQEVAQHHTAANYQEVLGAIENVESQLNHTKNFNIRMDEANTALDGYKNGTVDLETAKAKLLELKTWVSAPENSARITNYPQIETEINTAESQLGVQTTYRRIDTLVDTFNSATDPVTRQAHKDNILAQINSLGNEYRTPDIVNLQNSLLERNIPQANTPPQTNSSPAPEQPAAQPNAQQEGDRPARAPAGQESEPQTPRTSAAARLQENIERHIGNTRDRVAEQAENLRDIAVDNAREAVGRVSDGVKRVKTRVRKRKASDETDDDGAV